MSGSPLDPLVHLLTTLALAIGARGGREGWGLNLYGRPTGAGASCSPARSVADLDGRVPGCVPDSADLTHLWDTSLAECWLS
jgi:hypothetical protein